MIQQLVPSAARDLSCRESTLDLYEGLAAGRGTPAEHAPFNMRQSIVFFANAPRESANLRAVRNCELADLGAFSMGR
jgi:hypothetical protein